MYPFGRFTDSFKPKHKSNLWNVCEKEFTNKKYHEYHKHFFEYLQDDGIDNVHIETENEHTNFNFSQGSKIIYGTIKDNKISAEAQIAEFEKPSVAFMRRLMEINYTLYYSRFCLKDNIVCLKFDSYINECPPGKLYYGLKEVAQRADKQDEILTEDFKMLKIINNARIEKIPDTELEIKYKYLIKWITDTLNRISQLNEDAISGGISYMLLNLIYKIDYFIQPEGSLLNKLEKASWQYFSKDNKPFIQKNRELNEILKKISETPKEEILKDLYRTTYTFGLANPAQHQAVVNIFQQNIDNVKWYIDNNYEDIAICIYEYLATYSLFSYGLPKPTQKLFGLMLNITNQDIFREMGYMEQYYEPTNKKFYHDLIKQKIDAIIEKGRHEYPGLSFKTENLQYNSITSFLRTYILEIQNLNYNS